MSDKSGSTYLFILFHKHVSHAVIKKNIKTVWYEDMQVIKKHSLNMPFQVFTKVLLVNKLFKIIKWRSISARKMQIVPYTYASIEK